MKITNCYINSTNQFCLILLMLQSQDEIHLFKLSNRTTQVNQNGVRMIKSTILKSNYMYTCTKFTANWTEARTIKYTNFLAKHMNSLSKLHWNIHGVPIRSVLCEIVNGVLVFQSCTIMQNVIVHSVPFQIEFWKFLTFMIFFGIFPINDMFESILILNTTTKLALITKL